MGASLHYTHYSVTCGLLHSAACLPPASKLIRQHGVRVPPSRFCTEEHARLGTAGSVRSSAGKRRLVTRGGCLEWPRRLR